MIRSDKIALLGGDERQIYMARILARRGWNVMTWGLGESDDRVCPAQTAKTPEEALKDASTVLLPMPASVDGIRVNCPLDRDASLRFSTLLDIWRGKLLLGGKMPPVLQSYAKDGSVCLVDYYDDEILQLKNAVPTAEGALAIAMRELPVTIDGIHAAVIGYGRIARVLSDKLTALGAHVYLYARKQQDLARASLCHLAPMRLAIEDGHSTLERLPRDCRVIFNTVPYTLFTREVIETLPTNCLYIDLASAPGGIDWSAAGELGQKTIWGTALPGKCTPESAGRILAETIESILESKGVTLC